MERKTNGRTVLWYEIGAFSLLIVLSWADELFGVPALLFGGSHAPNFREAGLETIIILLVGIPTVIATRRVAARLFYLEAFLKVCAWCKNVEHDGNWIPIAEFMEQRFDARTSHGICPTCFASQDEIVSVA